MGLRDWNYGARRILRAPFGVYIGSLVRIEFGGRPRTAKSRCVSIHL